MVTVTDRATKLVMEILWERGAGRDDGLRVMEKDGNLTLEVDSPKDDDRVVKYFGSTLLIVNQGLEEKIGEVIVDVDESPQGEQIIVRHQHNA